MAISAVAYHRAVDTEGCSHVGFFLGKSKLAPRTSLTVPRLELCSAVLAVEMADLLTTELDIELQQVKFYTNSIIVQGYIHNTSRRFYVYVTNRVAKIRGSTHPSQWYFISTDQSPADHGTRPGAIDMTWLVLYVKPDLILEILTDELTQARVVIIRTVQQETFSEELKLASALQEIKWFPSAAS